MVNSLARMSVCMIRRYAAALLIFLSAYSYGCADIYSDCRAAIERGDAEQVKKIAGSIRRFSQFGAKLAAAEDCVSAAEGYPVRYWPSEGTFISAEEYQSLIIEKREAAEAERERRLAEDAARTAAEASARATAAAIRRQSELRQQENNDLIAEEVFEACKELYVRDWILAMTSELCVQSFRVNGHPRLRMD